MPSRKSAELKQDSRRAIRPASCCSLRTGEEASRSIALLLPRIESGALAAISAAKRDRSLLQARGGDDFVDEADLGGALRLEVAAGEEQLLGAGEADRVDELAQAGVAVDEAELTGGMPSLAPAAAIRRSQVTASSSPPPTQPR